MAGIDFRLPGYEQPLASPESFVTGMLRNLSDAAEALGAASSRLVVRLAEGDGSCPDYQIQTIDGEDAVAYSGKRHEPLFDDITRHLEEDQLQDQTYTQEQVKDWLNALHGEGTGGGPVDPVLAADWETGDRSDPRD
jgi:hypothetical protein